MNKIIGTLTLAKRAGKLVLGFDAVKESLQKGEVTLLLTASDLSEGTCKEIRYLSKTYSILHRTIALTLDELWYLLGKRAGVIGVRDKPLGDKIMRDNEQCTIDS